MSQTVVIFESQEAASYAVADVVERCVKNAFLQGRTAVLGLPVGKTQEILYRELVRRSAQGIIDFRGVEFFLLDEYWPLSQDNSLSLKKWIYDHFFVPLKMSARKIHFLSCSVEEAFIEGHCQQYEMAIKEAGGIDLQILGIGMSGHIAFNEPGSSAESVTRRVELDAKTQETMKAAASQRGELPSCALTMGVRTILEAREIVMMAFGTHKAALVRNALEGEISNMVPASFLRMHTNVAWYLDTDAASMLEKK